MGNQVDEYMSPLKCKICGMLGKLYERPADHRLVHAVRNDGRSHDFVADSSLIVDRLHGDEFPHCGCGVVLLNAEDRIKELETERDNWLERANTVEQARDEHYETRIADLERANAELTTSLIAADRTIAAITAERDRQHSYACRMDAMAEELLCGLTAMTECRDKWRDSAESFAQEMELGATQNAAQAERVELTNQLTAAIADLHSGRHAVVDSTWYKSQHPDGWAVCVNPKCDYATPIPGWCQEHQVLDKCWAKEEGK